MKDKVSGEVENAENGCNANSEADGESLIASAASAAKFSYSPYSGFRVGAALLSVGGKVYTGCNVESASYSLTMCAERTALFKAVSEGERQFKALAVVALDGAGGRLTALPCGACRQALAEFCGDATEIFIVDEKGKIQPAKLSDYLPKPFRLNG